MGYIIEVENLTKDFGHGRGVFDVDLQVAQGECFGFLGPNGAGKTTTIRHLMGFTRPDRGITRILGKDCWRNRGYLQNVVGYLPGEIPFPGAMKGTAFLNMMAGMRREDSRRDELLATFDLDPRSLIEEMSLGEKRKLAVVTAFMHDPQILILDEPTSGLDPAMQERFIDFLRAEKEHGKTIFLSSHIFHEVDAVCDRIAIIRAGRLVTTIDPEEFRERDERTYRLTFREEAGLRRFLGELPASPIAQSFVDRTAVLRAGQAEVQELVRTAAANGLVDLEEMPFTLEDYFMGFYEQEDDNG